MGAITGMRLAGTGVAIPQLLVLRSFDPWIVSAGLIDDPPLRYNDFDSIRFWKTFLDTLRFNQKNIDDYI